jgi:thioredoxin-related protein
MRKLYDKYKSRGFEIYQISLDRSKLLWEEGAANVPWISVRDENGPETSYIASYNVQALPTMFLMNQKGEVILRAFDFKTIDNAISKLL